MVWTAGPRPRIASWRGYRCLGIDLSTDPDGRFRWDEAPADEVEIAVNLGERGYLRARKPGVLPGIEDVIFTLKPTLVVSGAVRRIGYP